MATAPLYTEITAAVRALLDDLAVTGGAIYTDQFLDPLVKHAQDTLVAQLSANSVQQLMFRTEIVVPAGTSFLSFSFDPNGVSTPTLPDNFLEADQLWEATVGGNLIANPNDFGFTPWDNNGTVNPTVTTGITDPFGGTSATTWTYGAAVAHKARLLTTSLLNVDAYNTLRVWISTAPGFQITFVSPVPGVSDYVYVPQVGTTWKQVYVSFGPKTQPNPVYQQISLDFGTAIGSVSLYYAELGLGQTKNEEFWPMSGPNEIPRIPSTERLKFWNWFGNRLWFLPATQDRLLRLDYWGDLATASYTSTTPIMVVNARAALAALVAGIAARSRGQHEIADRLATFNRDGTIGGQAGVEINAIINREVKAQQSEPVRRRPYFGRDRYSNADYWIRGRT